MQGTLDLQYLECPHMEAYGTPLISEGEDFLSLARLSSPWIIRSQHRANRSSHSISAFSNLLHSVTHNCKSPFFRRGSIAFIQSAPRPEGIWDSQRAVTVAKRFMILKRSGLDEVRRCKNVPNGARTSDVDVLFGSDGNESFILK